MDMKLSEKVIDARVRLVELEEKLRIAEAVALPTRKPSAEEVKLQQEEAKLQADIVMLKERLTRKDLPRAEQELAKQVATVRELRLAAEERRTVAREKCTKALIDLRRQIIRADEDVRRLERKQGTRRDEMERTREAMAERIRLLESGDATGTPDRSLLPVMQLLKAMQRELSELRKEVERLRADQKK